MKKNEIVEMPRIDEAITGNVQQKYYTVDEAISYIEPRIRAMFK